MINAFRIQNLDLCWIQVLNPERDQGRLASPTS